MSRYALLALAAVGGFLLWKNRAPRVVTKYVTTQPDDEPIIVSDLQLEGSYTSADQLHQVQVYEAPPWLVLEDGTQRQSASSWPNALTALDSILQLSLLVEDWSFEAHIHRGEAPVMAITYAHGLAEAIDAIGTVVFSQSDTGFDNYPIRSKALFNMIEFVKTQVLP